MQIDKEVDELIHGEPIEDDGVIRNISWIPDSYNYGWREEGTWN